MGWVTIMKYLKIEKKEGKGRWEINAAHEPMVVCHKETLRSMNSSMCETSGMSWKISIGGS